MNATEKAPESAKRKQTKEKFGQKTSERRKKLKDYRQENGKMARLPKENNLYFLDYIIKEMGKTYFYTARKAGLSEDQVYYWFVTDDCMLGQAKKLLTGLELKLEPEIAAKSVETENIDETEVCIIRLKDCTEKVQKNKGYHQVLEENAKKNGNLAFLSRQILKSGHSLYAVAKKSGFYYPAFRLFFINDDIKISKLLTICRSMGYKIMWNVKPIEEQK